MSFIFLVLPYIFFMMMRWIEYAIQPLRRRLHFAGLPWHTRCVDVEEMQHPRPLHVRRHGRA